MLAYSMSSIRHSCSGDYIIRNAVAALLDLLLGNPLRLAMIRRRKQFRKLSHRLVAFYTATKISILSLMYVRGVRGQVGMAAAVALYKKRKKNYKIRIIRNRSKTRRPISLPVATGATK